MLQTDIQKFKLHHLTKSSLMLFNRRTCAGQQTEAKPEPQETVCVAFVNLTGAAQ